jgi:prepilin-type N-terminal cleavage/methylation domain-containing protein
MKMFRKDEGFTLIELMVVVLIIGILVAIAIPVFNSAKNNAQKRSCFANERTLEGAAHSYEASTGGLPADSTPLDSAHPATAFYVAMNPGTATTSYVASMPVCPAQGTYSWTLASGQVTCANAVVNGVVTAGAHGHY